MGSDIELLAKSEVGFGNHQIFIQPGDADWSACHYGLTDVQLRLHSVFRKLLGVGAIQELTQL